MRCAHGKSMENSEQTERLRLQALESMRILDTGPEELFDRLTRFAANICETPIAAITLLDAKRQWFKSVYGLDVSETPREISFCTYTIRGREPFIVPDAQMHPDFVQNPLVTAPPHLRFYAGVPLITEKGFALGALAVMDRVPRTLSPAQLSTLRLLAEQVVVHIGLRRQRNELRQLSTELDRMNVKLRSQAEHLTEAQEIADIGSWQLILESERLICSKQVYRIFGISPSRKYESVASFMKSVHAQDRPAVNAAIEETLRNGTPLNLQHRIVRPGGEIRYVHQRAQFRSGGRRSAVLAGTVQDITEQHRSQEELRLLHACIARIQDIVMITEASPIDEPGPRIVFVNQAFETITGYRQDEVQGRSPRFLQGPGTDRTELRRIRLALEKREPVCAELINYSRSGEEFWLETNIVPVHDANRRVTHFVATQRDITQRKRAEAQIERLAFYDQLTGLPNRRLLMDRLVHALEAASRRHGAGALLYIDLDNFKALNDTLGHDKGDLLLQQVARRLETCVRKSNTVARLGGDEFIIILEDLHRDSGIAAAQAELVADKVLAAFSLPFRLNHAEHSCMPSIGVALFNHQVENVDELLKRADIAMYHAKASGRGTARFFDPELQSIVNARATLERELKQGLLQQQFRLYYQPQVDNAGRIVGVEALLRWQHPRNGLVYPDAFIPLAEETGLILQLGQWVLHSVCRQVKQWSSRPQAQELTVSINVSVREFRHPDFANHALRVIEEEGIDPARLKLELTEGLMIDDYEDVIAKMGTLKAKGIGFSLDDFGTGYSSLSHLKRLPLDQLKIDQSFVKDILTDPNDAAIARTIVSLGETLGLDVIAEGVETEGQRDFLERHGCHGYQGYLFSPPKPAEQI